MAKHFLLFLSFICILPLFVFSQSYKGSPYIRSYTTHRYPQLTENWSALQDNRGIIYFGGPGGVIQFNGQSWTTIPISNKSHVRSLALGENGRIYVGAQVEFGYLEADEVGRQVYHSLTAKIPKSHNNFDDVWQTFKTSNSVIFQTHIATYIYKDDTIKVLKSKNRFKYGFYVNGRYFVEEDKTGLLELKSDSLVLLKGSEIFSNERQDVHAILPYDENNLLVIDDVHGCYLFNNQTFLRPSFQANSFISDHMIYSGIRLKNGNYAIGTQQNGMIIMDKKGNIIMHLNKKSGLQNNSVRTIYQDQHDNLWLGLENGVDHVNITSPFSFLNELYGLEGRVVLTKLFNNQLYTGTNQGLFIKRWDTSGFRTDFELIDNSKGEIRTLAVENNTLLLGHHQGTFHINNKTAKHFGNPQYGTWIFRQIKGNENLLLVGHYYGLFLMEWKNNSWNYKGPIHGFNESSRFIEQDDMGNIWVSHANKGIWKIRLNKGCDSIASLDFYDEKHGLPSNIRNKVFKIHNEILYSTEKGIYQFDYKHNRFTEHPLTRLTGASHIKGLYEGYNKSIWFIGEGKTNNGNDLSVINEIGNIYQSEDKLLQLNHLPFQKIKNLNIEHIEAIDEKFTLFSTANGVIIYDNDINKNLNESFHAYIQRVEKRNQSDSIVFAGTPQHEHITNDTIVKIPYSINGLKFFVCAGYYENIEKITYKYFLEGLDKNWSEWSESIQKEYSHLPPGQYKFRVIAKNIYGKESTESSFQFIILTPWYRTTLAYIIYSFISLILLFLLIRFFTSRLKKRNQLLAEQVYIRTKEIETQKEEIEARNKKLEVLNEEKNYLIGVLSHDLKSPIHQIKGLATIFKLTSDNLTEEQKETVDKIFQSTDRVTKMISEILDITAIESQTIDIKVETVDLEKICIEVLSAFKDLAEKKNIQLCFEKQGDTKVKGDKNYLLQIVENLITNALKFSEENKCVYVSIESKENQVLLKVKDEGQGISNEDMKKLFGRFQKLSTKPTAGERSTGLGLSIVKKYVEAMKGKVWCESKAGEGATFIVQLGKAQ